MEERNEDEWRCRELDHKSWGGRGRHSCFRTSQMWKKYKRDLNFGTYLLLHCHLQTWILPQIMQHIEKNSLVTYSSVKKSVCVLAHSQVWKIQVRCQMRWHTYTHIHQIRWHMNPTFKDYFHWTQPSFESESQFCLSFLRSVTAYVSLSLPLYFVQSLRCWNDSCFLWQADLPCLKKHIHSHITSWNKGLNGNYSFLRVKQLFAARVYSHSENIQWKQPQGWQHKTRSSQWRSEMFKNQMS